MLLGKPLLGKIYEDDRFLTSGMLYEDDGRILLEMHNEGTNPEGNFLEQLAPGSAVKQADGSVAVHSAHMKPSPQVMSFYTGPKEQSCLLLNCRLVNADFTPYAGPYNFRRVVEVGRLVQMSDAALRCFGSKYSVINGMRTTIPALNSWLGESLMFCQMPFDDKTLTDTCISYGLRKKHTIPIGQIRGNQRFTADLQVVGNATSRERGTRAQLSSDTVFSTHSQERLSVDDHMHIHL